MLKCAALVKEAELQNVMVTNAYINGEPLNELLPFIDAFNVDLKSFRDDFYKTRSGAKLRPVLNSIKQIKDSGKHLELTFLIIPGYNDSENEWEDMIRWIVENCGRETVLHVSRYFPRHKLNKPPTPLKTIQAFLEKAESSLEYVYPGNTPQLENHTHCPECDHLLIQRNLYNTSIEGLTGDGCCKQCGHKIQGIFKVA
jgi:pyruvate formate lyase activating enzyme